MGSVFLLVKVELGVKGEARWYADRERSWLGTNVFRQEKAGLGAKVELGVALPVGQERSWLGINVFQSMQASEVKAVVGSLAVLGQSWLGTNAFPLVQVELGVWEEAVPTSHVDLEPNWWAISAFPWSLEAVARVEPSLPSNADPEQSW